MTYVITQACCNDASCVPSCPADAIHPTPGEPGYRTAEMLYIDPVACIDCGACVDVCPVSAIYPDSEVPMNLLPFEEVNAAYYQAPREDAPTPLASSRTRRVSTRDRGLRVAIVGSGPSGFYTASELIEACGQGVQISIFEKLPVPYGLLRFGVAPDHETTKTIARMFQSVAQKKNVDIFLNVEVGKHITHDELLDHHDAVVYALGAAGDQKLGIDGEDLAGSHSATEFVAWYNGHPDYTDRRFDLGHRRAVVIGNGNVALDVARVLTADLRRLAETDIADHALAALAESRVEEVVVVGRRSAAQAAFTTAELLGLRQISDIDLASSDAAEAADDGRTDPLLDLKLRYLAEIAQTPMRENCKRISLRFLRSPVEILGDRAVTGIRLVRNELRVDHDGTVSAVSTEDYEELGCGLVLRSVGYRGIPTDGVEFSGPRNTLLNSEGRALHSDDKQPIRSVYTVGWVKRGPSGVIGTNKLCAEETVRSLLSDYQAGALGHPGGGRKQLSALLVERQPELIDFTGWKKIDDFERAAGRNTHRPRIKLVNRAQMVSVSRGAQ